MIFLHFMLSIFSQLQKDEYNGHINTDHWVYGSNPTRGVFPH